MNRASFALVTATALTSLAILSACGTGDSGSDAPAGPAASRTPTGGAALVVAEVGSLGRVVTSADGKTVYRFDKDTAKPSASYCEGECATQWPPVLADPAGLSVQGIDQNLVATVARADGTKQVTLDGWPLYRFIKDTAPGQANGQGVGGIWFAVTPAGAKAVPAQAGEPGVY